MKNRAFKVIALTIAAVLAAALPSSAGVCTNCCGSSPLILDLEHRGYITAVDLFKGVQFDLNADGFPEKVGWTLWEAPFGFLWLDLNGNKKVDSGQELFGDSTLLPDNSLPPNGFIALATYDRKEFGGNHDGRITPADRIWGQLRLWIDSSHDGVSTPDEIFTLDDFQVVEIDLDYTDVNQVDGAGNNHRLRGTFLRRVKALGRTFRQKQLIEDVFFIRR